MKPKLNRIYFTGSEWLYYKIYTGFQTTDYLLISILNPLITKFLEKHIIDKWFFIRYIDSEHHLRIRFHLLNNDHLGYIITKIHEALKPYISTKVIYNIQLDTYKREIERYGENTIEEAEWLFHFNSILILKIISSASENSKLRWLLGMKGIDIFLNQWGFSLLSKKIFMQELKNAFGLEFGVNKNIKKQLSLKFRNNRKQIENILNNEIATNYIHMFNEFSESNIHFINSIRRKNKIEHNRIEIDDLLNSFIHMHCNRLFKSNQRLNEWVIYDLLFQHYQSAFARKFGN